LGQALSQAAFRAIVEEAPDAIIVVDAGGQIAYVNAQAESVFGYTRADLLGQRIEVLIPDDRRAMHVIHREVYQESPESRPMGAGLDLSGRRKDGTTFPVEISLSVFTDGSQRFSVAVVRDVTRQRRAEETLRRSEERHRLLNERAENVVFRYRLSPTPGFDYVSAAVTARLGYTPEDLYVDAGLIFRLTHPDDRHVMEQALSASPPNTVSLRILTRDGGVRWFEFSITAVRGPGDVVIALEGIARDVTERRAADEERLRLQAEVEMQLERSRIAGDLHDDTIQSIYALGLQLHAVRDEASVTREAAADRAIEGLNAIIASLRSYMHRLSGADQEVEEPETLEQRIRGLIAPDSPTQWTVDVEPSPALDAGVERHIYLLAKELVANVQRHAEAAHATLSLRPDDGDRLLLAVTDDGVGFDRDAVGEGSFGLRSVEMRASTLGAALDVVSRPGGGTRVSVRLPRTADTTPLDATP
jgi:PAS domain S-box-containing protein